MQQYKYVLCMCYVCVILQCHFTIFLIFFPLVGGVDGGWSDWTDVTTCSSAGTCGGGTKNQIRNCDNPPRVAPGDDCPGDNSRTVICYAAAMCNEGKTSVLPDKTFGVSN